MRRKYQKTIPAKMRTRGTPTARPTIIPRLEPEWLVEDFWLSFALEGAGSAVVIMVIVVIAPFAPVETEVCVAEDGDGDADNVEDALDESIDVLED